MIIAIDHFLKNDHYATHVNRKLQRFSIVHAFRILGQKRFQKVAFKLGSFVTKLHFLPTKILPPRRFKRIQICDPVNGT